MNIRREDIIRYVGVGIVLVVLVSVFAAVAKEGQKNERRRYDICVSAFHQAKTAYDTLKVMERCGTPRETPNEKELCGTVLQ